MRENFFVIPVAVLALATGCHYAPSPGPSTPQQTEGDVALRLHIGGIHPAAKPVADEALQTDTIEVAMATNQDSLDAASRARADSLGQARTATDQSARESADSAARMSAALREDLAVIIHFAFDRSKIQPEDHAALNRKAAILTANPDVRLRIAGACDERGSDQYNLALGSRRAAAARQYLIGRGVDAGQLDEISAGERSPIDPGRNEAAWVQNRRAEFEIVNGGGALTEPIASR
jgi:peptidoglycan-associated lipoprotein